MSQERTVEDLIKEFNATLDKMDNTKISYAGILDRYARYLRANNITKPTEIDIVNYKNKYLKKRVKSATIQKYIVVLRRFYSWCHRHHYYDDNIALALQCEKINPTFQRKALTIEQTKKLLHKAKIRSKKSIVNFRNYVIITLIVMTGLRTIEVARANVEDIIDDGEQAILLIQGKGHDGKDAQIKLPSHIMGLITEYLMKRESDSDALFLNHGNHNGGDRIVPKTISYFCKDLLSSIGLDGKEYTAHSLRHTCATLALKNGAKESEVQMVLRHKSINTTMIYSHHIERETNNTELIVADAILKKN